MTINQTIGPVNSQTSYLPSDFELPENYKDSKEIIAERQRKIANILNVKENAQYEMREVLTGQQWFSSAQNGAIKTTYSYRLTFDLVALNGAPIPIGATTFNLTSSTQPALIPITTSIQPVHGFGACSNGTNFYFINDPLVYVTTNVWTNVSQTITITNNTGSSLTQCVWVFEYFKF